MIPNQDSTSTKHPKTALNREEGSVTEKSLEPPEEDEKAAKVAAKSPQTQFTLVFQYAKFGLH